MFLRDSMTFVVLVAASTAVGCRQRQQERPDPPGQPGESAAAAKAPASAPAPARASARVEREPPEPCPDGMVLVPGSKFQVGSPERGGTGEESPTFETEIASFCLDRNEVTVAEYRQCVERDGCKPAHDERRFCNVNYDDRDQHPINCVSWHQADAFCRARGARLPTEFEWEFAARGGAEYRKYPWGDAHPDGNTCWKHPGGSCEVGQFTAGAFGLHDITGNVWEWTESWYGKYPWPPEQGLHKVYRGGSWSRRFVKWMRPRLRNRWRPDEWGSHLGFRCALTPDQIDCPFGRSDGQPGCRHGVTSIECPKGEAWNGVRCAREGEPKCPPGRREEPGHGCVLENRVSGKLPEPDLSGVSRSRSPRFDRDCEQHYPGRPQAYRYSGGTHHARNVVSRRAGCSNRDVGVGWNSSCCP